MSDWQPWEKLPSLTSKSMDSDAPQLSLASHAILLIFLPLTSERGELSTTLQQKNPWKTKQKPINMDFLHPNVGLLFSKHPRLVAITWMPGRTHSQAPQIYREFTPRWNGALWLRWYSHHAWGQRERVAKDRVWRFRPTVFFKWIYIGSFLFQYVLSRKSLVLGCGNRFQTFLYSKKHPVLWKNTILERVSWFAWKLRHFKFHPLDFIMWGDSCLAPFSGAWRFQSSRSR